VLVAEIITNFWDAVVRRVDIRVIDHLRSRTSFLQWDGEKSSVSIAGAMGAKKEMHSIAGLANCYGQFDGCSVFPVPRGIQRGVEELVDESREAAVDKGSTPATHQKTNKIEMYVSRRILSSPLLPCRCRCRVSCRAAQPTVPIHCRYDPCFRCCPTSRIICGREGLVLSSLSACCGYANGIGSIYRIRCQDTLLLVSSEVVLLLQQPLVSHSSRLLQWPVANLILELLYKCTQYGVILCLLHIRRYMS
jgi:hypothetical protein